MFLSKLSLQIPTKRCYSTSTSDPSSITTLFQIITNSPSTDSMITSLHSSNLRLTPSTIDSLLNRFRFSHANPTKALHFFLFSTKHSPPSPSSFDTLLYILGRSRQFDTIWSLLTHHRRTHRHLITPKTIQIVLARIAKCCSVHQTVESFRKFKKLISPFDTECFNALLRTLAQEKSMNDARNVYHSVKHDFKPNIQTFNILLSGWKSSDEAESFFNEMLQLEVEPNLVTYNCLIDVYCKCREVEKAYEVVGEMRAREMEPDIYTYTSLIGGLGLVGQPDKARGVLEEMREAGVYPDVAAYNAAIRNYCIAKRLGHAFELMEEMVGRGLEPNVTSYSLFFKVFYWANDLESCSRLYGKMKEKGCLPNTQICLWLVRLFRRYDKVEMAMELWGDMVENGFGSFTLVSDVLFDLLCDLGKLEEAEKCFHDMADKGQKPSHVSFRRIKVLMELANRHDSIKKLEEKMALLGNSIQFEEERTKESSRVKM